MGGVGEWVGGGVGWPPMVVICWIGRSARTTFLMLEAYRALGAAVVGDLLDTADRQPAGQLEKV